MSASIPKRNAPDSLEDEGGGRTKWIALSILAHAILLFWIFNLKTPAAQALNDAAAKNGGANAEDAAAQPTPTPLDDKLAASPERVEEVAKEINDIQADQVKDKVQELLATEQELEEVNKEKLQDFSALAKELSKDAPEKINAALDAAAQAQEAARQAEEAALKAEGEFVQAKSDLAAATTSGTTAAATSGTATAATSGTATLAASGTAAPATSGTATPAAPPVDVAALKAQVAAKEQETRAAQEKAKDAQATASDAQTKAAQQLAFEGDTFAAAKKALEGATAAQEEANNKQDDASSKVNEIGWAEQTLRSKQQTVDLDQKMSAMFANQLDSQKKSLEALKAQTQQLTDSLQTAEAAAADAKTKLQQAADGKDKAAAKLASTKADQAVTKIQSTLVTQLDRTTKASEHLQTTQQKLDELNQKAVTAGEELAQAKINVEKTPRKAVEGQQEALTAQQNAADLQAKAKGEIAKAGTAEQALAAAMQPETSATDTPAADQNVDGKNFAQLYQMAADTEKQIAATYKDIRAAESAKLRQIPISEAAKSIQVALPVRPPLDPSIAASNVKSTEALNIHNEAMEKALQQIDSMVAVSRGMAYQAQGQQQMNVSVEDMKAEAAEAARLAELADENEGTVAVDVSGMMKQIEDGNGKQDEGGGNGPDLGGNGAAGGSAANGAPGAGAGSGNGRRGASMGEGGPPAVEHVADSVPGRKVHAEGQGVGAKWMYIDTWLIIGPFPNPARRNIDTKFPPDSVIDLDASYVGKNDELVHWRFKQANEVAIHPFEEQPYAIYYAYTTLWFDEPRDMWIAIGSDDYSKIWINDMLVWSSGRIQKGWRADEGFRKVHFKKGLNRILDRVENGQNVCMYSVMLNLQKK